MPTTAHSLADWPLAETCSTGRMFARSPMASRSSILRSFRTKHNRMRFRTISRAGFQIFSTRSKMQSLTRRRAMTRASSTSASISSIRRRPTATDPMPRASTRSRRRMVPYSSFPPATPVNKGQGTEWPQDETQALVALASARRDGLLMPAEKVSNVSVAALNPPGMPNAVSHAPARYSRRGPGLRAGVKPDLAHFGGSGSPQTPVGHGLFSIKPDGSTCDGCGTSYATPLVAKTAAVLDQSIEGEVSRETLIGLLLHHV